ncbi:MAG: hypothetical protein WC071_00730 [Victivallaceae bacterium]
MFIEQIPLWFFYAVSVGIVFSSVLVGFWLGSILRRNNRGSDAPVGTIVGSMLGLLAFILAFTFGMAASRFDARKQLLLDETNAIGTAFLRADFLPAVQCNETKKLLLKYVNIRTGMVGHPDKLAQALIDSDKLHAQLWAQVSGIQQLGINPVLPGLYAQALNDVIDFHSKRVTVGYQYRIPGSFWMALYFVTILTMGMVGYDFGINGRGVIAVSLILALAFSAIIVLIEDLDRPTEGMLKVSQQPMFELQEKISKGVE